MPQTYSIIKEFSAMIDEINSILSPAKAFKKLIKYNLSRVELMIIDSAIKGLSIENIDKTLLLTKDNYLLMLQNLTGILVELYYRETHSTTSSTGCR